MCFTDYAQKVAEKIDQSVFCLADQAVKQSLWLQTVIQRLNQVKQQGSTLYILGNGGSAAIASHAQVDFINMLGIKANCLQDSAVLTCFSNDYGYENAYAHILKKLAQPQDLLWVISSSGNSQNLIQAAEIMLKKSCHLISLTGFKADNRLRQLTLDSGGESIWLPSCQYGEVETGHQLMIHALVDLMKDQLVT